MISKTEFLLADATIELAKAVAALATAIDRIAQPDDDPTRGAVNQAMEAAKAALDVIRQISAT